MISGIGCGEEEIFRALQEKRSAIGNLTFLETALSRFPVSEVKMSNDELAHLAGLPAGKIYSRTFLLGIIAAQQAVSMAGCEAGLPLMGILGATTVGGMDLSERYYGKLIQEKEIVQSLECADCTEQIAGYFGIKSNVMTMSTACSSSANAIMNGVRMIKNGILEGVLVGGMDALTRFTLNGFNSLEIVSPSGCRPFDRDRDGITIGEGAAFLVLESEESAAGKPVYGEITGYANRNEAFHQTASSPDGLGAVMTITRALEVAGLQPADIDYINAHGTGTQINDLSEGNALQTVFGKEIPPVSSTKGFTAHTLAAAGAIEAVLSILAIKYQVLLPNIRWENPIAELSFVPETEMKPSEIRHVLSNSFGFGGSNSTIIISKPRDITVIDGVTLSHPVNNSKAKHVAYINSISLISPQQTFDGSLLKHPAQSSHASFLLAAEPPYKDFINPVQLRRMSHILKMGLGASTICMNNLPETDVEAIVIGTGLACIVDLEKFLLSLLNEEQMLSPIPFINSSHNTVAAQIAMMKKIKGYNNTYCHRGSSFECALQDALMLLQEREVSNVLVGGIDEYSQHYFDLFDQFGAWRKEPECNLDLFEGSRPGTIAGEGAGFFILEEKPSEKTYAAIVGVHSFLNPESNAEIESAISTFLATYNLTVSDLDIVVLGKNGDNISDAIYSSLEQGFFANETGIAYYKHLCGEYMTSTAFALWLASNMLKTKEIPPIVSYRKKQRQSFRNLLIYNHYFNINHSLILLQTEGGH